MIGFRFLRRIARNVQSLFGNAPLAHWRHRPEMRSFAHFQTDSQGMAVVEFALCLPFLALLYLGSYQLMDALACNRKVTVTTRAIADLTSQYSTLGTAGADQILSASAQILAPYNAANALFRVSQLYTDKNGTTTVMWSRAKNGSALVTGATVTPPATILVNDNYLIYAEVSYTYTPIARYGLLAPIALADTVYMSPRVSTSVKLQ